MGLEGGEGVEGAGGGGSDEGFYHVVEVGLHPVGGLAVSWTEGGGRRTAARILQRRSR